MIGRLTGILAESRLPSLVLDVGGVGYEVEAPISTFARLPGVGAKVQLYIHLVVRDDAHLLYGFIEERERNLFRTLIKVNGVGPKLALAILSGIEAEEFVACVREQDAQPLTRVPGVGKKTAQRLIVEMTGRLGEWGGRDVPSRRETGTQENAGRQRIRDAEAALVSLGYKPQDAARAIARVDNEADLDVAGLIRSALKNMA